MTDNSTFESVTIGEYKYSVYFKPTEDIELVVSKDNVCKMKLLYNIICFKKEDIKYIRGILTGLEDFLKKDLFGAPKLIRGFFIRLMNDVIISDDFSTIRFAAPTPADYRKAYVNKKVIIATLDFNAIKVYCTKLGYEVHSDFSNKVIFIRRNKSSETLFNILSEVYSDDSHEFDCEFYYDIADLYSLYDDAFEKINSDSDDTHQEITSFINMIVNNHDDDTFCDDDFINVVHAKVMRATTTVDDDF